MCLEKLFPVINVFLNVVTIHSHLVGLVCLQARTFRVHFVIDGVGF